MRRTLAFQLYNSKRLRYLHARIEIAAEVYNHFIAVLKRYYRRYRKYPGYQRLQKLLPKLKRAARYAHWTQAGSQALQDIVRRIDFGYQKFFRKENKRPPTFRKRHKYASFTLTQAGWRYLGDNRLSIGGRLYRFHASRPIEGTIKTVTIKRLPTGRMMVCFSCVFDQGSSSKTLTGHSVGFDFGLSQFLTGSDGTEATGLWAP